MTKAQLPLRDYQEQALAAVRADWTTGVQRPAVVAPTGAGKTVMFAHMIKDHLKEHGTRALVLVHRDELADQAIDKIRQVAPDLQVGKVKAEAAEYSADVVVASVQTLARETRLDALLNFQAISPEMMFGLVVVDEAHHAVAPTWKRVMEKLGARFDDDRDAPWDTRFVGFSATLARGDQVGLGSVWQKVSHAISLTRLIRRGFLANPRGLRVTADKLDLSDVRRSGGDYQAGALGEAMADANTELVIAEAYKEHASDRPGVVFTPTVATAEDAAAMLNAVGIPSAVITGDTPREDRKLIYKRYQAGDLQVLVNCMVLTEGFDAPWASCAVIARPTQSAPLYAQMVGRVLRPYPGKRDALVLDVVGVSGRHKLATLIDLEPGVVRSIADGQTLLEAEDEELAEEAVRHHRATPTSLTAAEVDLFAASRSVWLRTPAGVWFVPTREGDFFLWPNPHEAGQWDACLAPAKVPGYRIGPWQRLHTGLTLELAMSWAQVEAEEADASIASRDASWRKRKAPASDGQKDLIRKLTGVTVTEINKSEASDVISVALASKRFDRRYQKVTG